MPTGEYGARLEGFELERTLRMPPCAQALGDGTAETLAIQRLLLLHAVTLGFGGVPLLYMGDELATLNDYSFEGDPLHAPDNRWVHRPAMDWDRAEQRLDPSGTAGRMYTGLQQLIQARKRLPHLHASVEAEVYRSPNPAVLFLARRHPVGTLLGLYNFSEQPQPFPVSALTPHFVQATDAISGAAVPLVGETITLAPYGRLWLIDQKTPD